MEDSDSPTDEATPTVPPTTTDDKTSQYSPSISHDEEADVYEWEAPNNDRNTWEHSHVANGTKEQEEDSEEWEDFGDGSVTSGEGGVWHEGGRSESVIIVRPTRTPASSNGRMKLKHSTSSTSGTQPAESAAPHSTISSTPVSPGGKSLESETSVEFRSAMRGRLSEADLARLEAKS